MAAAMIAGFAKLSKNIPQFIIVEPENATVYFKVLRIINQQLLILKKKQLWVECLVVMYQVLPGKFLKILLIIV